jgi:RNA-directed DNA polymerase
MQGGECEMAKRADPKPATVPFGATPAGQPATVREWANRHVWTDRMLDALHTGVRGGKWHALSDKVYGEKNLFFSALAVVENKGCAGVDNQTVEDFREQNLDELKRLTEDLRTGKYQPHAVKRVWIPKLGSKEKRPLGIPAVRDRVVQTALLNVLEPIFDVTFAEHSYGFRKGRGCHHALERIEVLLNAGYTYIVDADLKAYFDTIPKDRLLDRVGERVSDQGILGLVKKFLDQRVMDGLSEHNPIKGTPQGAVISPLLANIYLNPLDHLMAESGFEMIRYADDFVIMCRSREEADRALAVVAHWVEENDLMLHPTKTKVVDSRTDGFDFLGYTFRGWRGEPGRLRLVRKKSMDKLKDFIRAKTKRSNGNSLTWTINTLNLTLRGWFGYFRHCHWNVYTDLDGYIRGRLRGILRKRRGSRGRGRGLDHQRWPNTYFDEHKLYSLARAHARFASPLTG